MPSQFPIALIERETGLSKDVLRKWESRYGFPLPTRSAKGERLYSGEDLNRLRLIRRLLDAGRRPAEVVPLSLETLTDLVAGHLSGEPALSPTAFCTEVLGLLREHRVETLRHLLKAQLARHGLEGFVLDIMPELNVAVGDAWMRGELHVFEEHLYSDVITGVLRKAVGGLTPSPDGPRVLLTTVPGELHALGLLMVEALLSMHGCRCVSLGPQTPLGELGEAVNAFRADMVGLSFSAAFPVRRIAPLLQEIRRQLPTTTALWAGGAAMARLGNPPEGVFAPATLREALAEVGSLRHRPPETERVHLPAR